jgi:hypothetical protein
LLLLLCATAATVSPADYNADETQTSLTYAARVKLITNNANKNQDGAEVSRLKAIIKKLQAGEKVDLDAAVSGSVDSSSSEPEPAAVADDDQQSTAEEQDTGDQPDEADA